MRQRLLQLFRNLAVNFLGYLPRGLAAPVAGVLGRLAYKLDNKGRRRAMENLTRTNTGAGEAERDAIVRAMYRHLALTIIEVLWTDRHMDKALDNVEIVGKEQLDNALAQGKGALFMGMHLGNWELSGSTMGLTWPGTATIVREQADQGLDAILAGHRTKGGLKLFPNTRDQGPAMAAHVMSGHGLGILMDVYASRKHPAVPFLGVPTPTFLGPADLARTLRCPVVTVSIERLKPFRHRLTISPPLALTWTDDKEADLLRATEQFNDAISARIRANPTQWLWIMKRWKD